MLTICSATRKQTMIVLFLKTLEFNFDDNLTTICSATRKQTIIVLFLKTLEFNVDDLFFSFAACISMASGCITTKQDNYFVLDLSTLVFISSIYWTKSK